MSEKDDRTPSPEEEQRGNTGEIKPPTRESGDPPAQGENKGNTGEIKPPTE